MRRLIDADKHAIDRGTRLSAKRHRDMASRLRHFVELDRSGDRQIRGQDDVLGIDTLLPGRYSPALAPLDAGDAGILEDVAAGSFNSRRQPDEILRRVELRLMGKSQRSRGCKRQWGRF